MRKLIFFLVLPFFCFADIQQMVESSVLPESSNQALNPSLAVEQAHIPNTAVLAWMNEAMVSTFSFDFANFERSFQQASNYYTPQGWLEMDKRHTEMKDLEKIKEMKMAMSAVATGPAKIISQGVVNNIYSWVVEAPYMLVASDISHSQKRNILVRSLIVRADPDVHYRGIAIDKIAIKYILGNPETSVKAKVASVAEMSPPIQQTTNFEGG
ncbi:MAG: DotI/IcmL family type IV secretion protein [Pseudomonadota bacterium]|nr:DotI/IcmL family type IV secretion protein [Pseudomonadota bacterium]